MTPTMHTITPGQPTKSEPCAAVIDNLQPLRALIGGGWCEIVHVLHNGKRAFMIVDEEGRLKGLPYNEEAHKIYAAASIEQGTSKTYHDVPPIAGIALLFEGVRLD